MKTESLTSLFYFAYGSNMSIRRLRTRVPSASRVGPGVLEGHRLRFHKVGRLDGSGKCDAVATGGDSHRVHGVVFRVTQADKLMLDRIEGLGRGYAEKRVSVRLAGGGTLDAYTYLATRIDPALKPFSWYKEHVLRGARENRLPTAYVSGIEAVEAVEDPDRERHAAEMAVYRRLL